jgi:hypothetical protein
MGRCGTLGRRRPSCSKRWLRLGGPLSQPQWLSTQRGYNAAAEAGSRLDIVPVLSLRWRERGVKDGISGIKNGEKRCGADGGWRLLEKVKRGGIFQGPGRHVGQYVL